MTWDWGKLITVLMLIIKIGKKDWANQKKI